MTYDESKLVTLVEAMDCFKEENIVKPEDAYLKYTENGYEIVPEKQGSQPLEEQIMLDVKAAIDSRQSVLRLSGQRLRSAVSDIRMIQNCRRSSR